MGINSDRSTAVDRAIDVIELLAANETDLPFSQILASHNIQRRTI